MNTRNKVFYLLFWVYLIIAAKILVFRYPLTDILRLWDKRVITFGLSSANFIPFKTIKMYIRYRSSLNSFANLFGNLFILTPLGILLPFAWKKKHSVFLITAVGFLVSMAVETLQLVLGVGAFDVDDLILNTLGVIVGYVLYKIGELLYRAINKN
ncbi:MAG: VanZ family protein [Lachnospiraceae bacterium]|jgi:glycopeptide antibiotics resistance protein|nr:VanZ family protein [Lachnospiraceae bacterium]